MYRRRTRFLWCKRKSLLKAYLGGLFVAILMCYLDNLHFVYLQTPLYTDRIILTTITHFNFYSKIEQHEKAIDCVYEELEKTLSKELSHQEKQVGQRMSFSLSIFNLSISSKDVFETFIMYKIFLQDVLKKSGGH